MKRIAIVEDNPDNRLLALALLEGVYECVEYETGIDAVAGMDHTVDRADHATPGFFGDGGPGKAVELIDEPGGHRGRAFIELRRVLLIGEEVGIADEEERDRLIRRGCGRYRRCQHRRRRCSQELTTREVHDSAPSEWSRCPG